MQMTLSKNQRLKLQMNGVTHYNILWNFYVNVTKINSVTVTCSLKIKLTNMPHYRKLPYNVTLL